MNKNKIYRINPYTQRRETVAINDIAIKDFWITDLKGDRHFIQKGTVLGQNKFSQKEDFKTRDENDLEK